MNQSKSTELLSGLLIRGYKPEFYTLLEEEMFDPGRDRKVFKALKSGYRHSNNDWLELREVAGLKASETADLMTQVERNKGWLNEKDILDFAKEYREKKVKQLVSEGEYEKALEYTVQDARSPSRSVIEDYRRSISLKRSRADRGLLGLPTGIPSLDKVTSGLQPSKVWIVGGYNAYGKTFFMTNLTNLLVDMGKRVCVVTLEMTKEDIIDRMIAEKLGLSTFELAKTRNKERVEEQIVLLEQHINDGHLIIMDSSYDIEDIISALKIENANAKIDVMFLDFLQLIQVEDTHNIYETVSRASARIQEVTKELGICSVILSQISNEAQKSGGTEVYGFKGAGEIGQIADVAIRIQRERDDTTGNFTPAYDLNLVKNRSGQTGIVFCKIEFPSGSITERGPEDIDYFGDM